MTAHFVSRQIYAGSARRHRGAQRDRRIPAQPACRLHPRDPRTADHLRRPIVNTRDESHSPSDYRRLHVIVGDANRMDVPQTLKLGATSMLLWAGRARGRDRL